MTTPKDDAPIPSEVEVLLKSGRFGAALAYATALHAGQKRKGTSIPYIAHLLGVASLAFEYGANEDEAIAALLHDAVEDQGGAQTLQQIDGRFGSTVAAIVDGCSDTDEDPKPPWRHRKEAYLERLTRESRQVRLVSACDKLHNVRAIIRDYHTLGDELWGRFQGGKDGTLWYYSALVKVYRAVERTPVVVDLAREVATLRRLVRARASHELSRFLGCLLGLAIGDAVGATVEFKERGSFSPLSDMVGGGVHTLKPGQWTDDTSMALCLATSLVEQDGFDARDQIDRYCQWRGEGYLSSTGRCFDIGNTTSDALDCYQATGEALVGPTDPNRAGNGSIMRLAPVPMFFYPEQATVESFSAESSRTTHGAAACVDACRLLGVLTLRALAGAPKDTVLSAGSDLQFDTGGIKAIATGVYRTKCEADIRGSGYVIDSLEAALWCFATTENFEAAILKAANLGDDADTTAAVCGQVAGAYYGESGIPQHWRERVAMQEDIRDLAKRLHAAHLSK